MTDGQILRKYTCIWISQRGSEINANIFILHDIFIPGRPALATDSSLFSTPVLMHGELICIAFCPSVRPSVCLVSLDQNSKLMSGVIEPRLTTSDSMMATADCNSWVK